MKKTLLATAITALFATTAAQAATVYEKDGAQMDIYGDVEVMFKNDISEDSGTQIHLDDADIGFGLSYDLSEGLSAVGKVAFSGEGGTLDLDESFVGFATEFGTITMGKQFSIYDDSGIGNDYEFGFGTFYEQADGGNQVLKYTFDSEMFYGGIAWVKNTETGTDQSGSRGFDGRIGMKVSDFDLVAYYANFESGATDVDHTNYNFEATWDISDFSLGLAYSMNETGDDDTSTVGVTGVYTMDKWEFGAGFASIDADADPDLSYQYFINGAYAFTSNVNTYVEIGSNDSDDSEFGYAVGMQLTF